MLADGQYDVKLVAFIATSNFIFRYIFSNRTFAGIIPHARHFRSFLPFIDPKTVFLSCTLDAPWRQVDMNLCDEYSQNSGIPLENPWFGRFA